MYGTGDSHEDAEKNLFRELRLHLTSNNSVKNMILIAVSCLVESLAVFSQKYLCASGVSTKKVSQERFWPNFGVLERL